MLAEDHAPVGEPGTLRMEVHGLVGLHDPPPLAVLAAKLQVHRAQAGDGRAARRGDHVAEGGEKLGGELVGGAGGLAHHPRGLGGGVPELEPPVPSVDLVAADGDRAAAGELRLRPRLRRGLGP